VEQISNEIPIGHSDRDIDALVGAAGGAPRPFTRHFNQGEEFFLKLDGEYTVPRMPIHHDVRQPRPGAAYLGALTEAVGRIAALAPQVLSDLAYFFDPAEILRPCFFKLYRIEDRTYLYLLRVELALKDPDAVVVVRGTNDMTATFRTRRLFLENTIIPLAGVVRGDDGKVQAVRLLQTVSQTWIGEFGRGYFQQGIWMDLDLTRFFTRLFLPAGTKSYPFFPFLCKYKTVCQSLVNLTPEGRTAAMPWLHRAIAFLVPSMEAILAQMKHGGFSEEMSVYRELKARVPEPWYEPWRRLRVEPYLNESDMKEFRVED
jgi:hypothetical protein